MHREHIDQPRIGSGFRGSDRLRLRDGQRGQSHFAILVVIVRLPRLLDGRELRPLARIAHLEIFRAGQCRCFRRRSTRLRLGGTYFNRRMAIVALNGASHLLESGMEERTAQKTMKAKLGGFLRFVRRL